MLSDQFPGTCAFDAPACQVGPRTGHSRAPLHCRLERGGSLEATRVLVNSRAGAFRALLGYQSKHVKMQLKLMCHSPGFGQDASCQRRSFARANPRPKYA